MEYIGDATMPAPRMSEIVVPEALADETLGIILEHTELFLRNGIIHGDLSPFNILWWKNKPYFIDFPQAVDVRESKRVYSLLKRDIQNVMKPFGYDEVEIEAETQAMLERNYLAGWDS
jgi:RIO kinase 1